MTDSASRLPARPSLEQLRKQARELLRAFQAATDTAIQRVRLVNPRWCDPTAAHELTLADAQHVVAREYGFDSWAKLVRHVDAINPQGLARYARLAEEVVRAYVAGDAMAIRELNATHNTSFVWDFDPERMRRRLPTWYASPSRSSDLALADARHLVAKQAGVDGWEELVAAVATVASAESRRAIALGPGGATSTPFYRVDEHARTIEVRGPMSEHEWDAVFAVMREMRLTSLQGAGHVSDSGLERLARLDHVTSVDLSFARRVTAAGLRHLARLPLESLELGGWGTQVDDAALAVLGALPQLRSVSLVWAHRISDVGVAHLAGCTRLESVNLMGTPTGDDALRALAGKVRLCHLDAGTRVTRTGLGILRDFPVFANPLPDFVVQRARATDGEPSHVSLHPVAFLEGGLEAMTGLSGVHSFRLFSVDRSVPPVSRAALEPLAMMQGLESFWCDPSDGAMAVIAAMPHLRTLMCQDTSATDDGWVALSRSTTIERIWGRENQGLTGRGLAALSAMSSVRVLGVNLRHVDDAGLAVLPSFPALRELTAIGLGDDGFSHVGRCERLEALTCMYTADMGDAGTAHIAGLRHLRRYYAGDAPITDRSLTVVGALPALESVELWSCTDVTNVGVAALARAPRLREVTLDGLPLVTRDVVRFFPAHVQVKMG
ncbi:MAG TPA: hypothetical protein VFZ21_07465 [Gemmatimonadaceae bacterium]|nr:hypothetical protein [Gemmatimonadaceae bacterium]